MKLVLSPTKTMDTENIPVPDLPPGNPAFEGEAVRLVRALSTLDRDGLKQLFKTSDALTQNVHGMIRGFDAAKPGPAMYTFRGEAFKTLAPVDFTGDQIAYAASHLRIFSGLYGVLAPLDRIKPYRLDFNTPLKIDGKGLKPFWKPKLIPYFEHLMEPGEALINLASGEYSAILASGPLKDRMITVQFRESDNGKMKNIPVRAKQARGRFARHIIRCGLSRSGDLKQTDIDGYVFSRELSSDREWFFIR